SADRIFRTVLRTKIDRTVMLRILDPERESNVPGKSRDIRLHDAFGKGKSFAPSKARTRLRIEADRLPSLVKRSPNITSQHNPSLALGNILGDRAQSVRFTAAHANHGDNSTARNHESDGSGGYFQLRPGKGAGDRSSQ